MDRGFFLTLQAIRRQLAAMPNEIYLVRLIHHQTRRAFPGERLWTASDLSGGPAVGFLPCAKRSHPPIMEFTVERKGCLGPCPVYKLSLASTALQRTTARS